MIRFPRTLHWRTLAGLLAWSLGLKLIFVLVRLAARISPNVRRKVGDRTVPNIAAMTAIRDRHSTGFVVLCSSAGEYEQALPLVQELEGQWPGAIVHLIFFSVSGISFAHRQGETRPFFLFPEDTIWTWHRIFAALRPAAIFVVRHEIWPAFAGMAYQVAPTILINGTSSGRPASYPRTWLKRVLLRFFDQVHVATANDHQVFAQTLGASTHVNGDTKYDRVRQRAEMRNTEIRRISARFSPAPRLRLIIGSAWQKDVDVALAAFSAFRRKYSGAQIVIAPHKPDDAFLQYIENECEKYQLTHQRFSSAQALERDCILADGVGYLFELYGSGSLAMVGGGLHFQVHNVLEPTVFNLPVAFGPLYQNSREAILLVEQGLATVVQDSAALLRWLQEQTKGEKTDRLSQYLKLHYGATARIVQQVKPLSEALYGTPDSHS